MGIISVKAGKNLNPSMVRDLRGTMEREGAQMGVFICLANPSSQMQKEASTAGFFDSSQGRHPRIQIRTIDELLAGAGIDCPLLYTTVTLSELGRKAERQAQKRTLTPSAEVLRQRNLLLPIISRLDKSDLMSRKNRYAELFASLLRSQI